MMVFDVFGKTLGIQKTQSEWYVFYLDQSTGKRSRAVEVVIPDFIHEDEIAGWLDDIYHESASATRPCVVRIK
ncbi:hypothetical protein SAMN05216202_2162 [Pseudomonas mucidolens]|uniref:DUF7661 domain-containing protein n=3 Tax=Pseudomonas mucidolens TaxID=46679 RepID=A0A1H2MQ19_9PSED|nr:hypothetical protein SAMN05216202_2162 [Pseudomonas mucidolens]